jgi:hypothetical protein
LKGSVEDTNEARIEMVDRNYLRDRWVVADIAKSKEMVIDIA